MIPNRFGYDASRDYPRHQRDYLMLGTSEADAYHGTVVKQGKKAH